ncbi:MAG: hypothetical protein K2H41_09505 [Acetatifactor sp.]|nr:hypothetical protein [Acetatifactor sp.]
MAVLVQAFFGTYALTVDGWGIASLLVFIGLAAAFRVVKGSGLCKNRWLALSAAFFSVCTVVGKSYQTAGNWSLIVGSPAVICGALAEVLGFYFLYRGGVLFIVWLLRGEKVFRRDCRGRAEELLFEKHPFLVPLAVMLICSLPVLISFFPGTLEADAYRQLSNMRSGDWDAHYPVMASRLMDGVLCLGQLLFKNDNLAFFMYTGTQYFLQCLVFAYTMSVLGRMRTPVVIRWGALVYFSLFSVFQMYGYTMVKDSMFYIVFILFAALSADIIARGEGVGTRRLTIALGAVSLLPVFFRNNGLHLILFTVAAGFLLCRKYKRLYLTMLAGALLGVLINSGVMHLYGVEGGSVREMLSVPLQQTARYLSEHYDEVTDEERKALEGIFEVELREVAALYQPEISDPVKDCVAYRPDREALEAYLSVWARQFLKHPGTYVQAFLNHTYGYFYPDRECFWEGIGVYGIGESWPWDGMDFNPWFVMENGWMRERIQQVHLWMSHLPVVSSLYSCGMHNFFLIGMCAYLLGSKKRQDLFLLIPCVGCVLICLISPVNALIRYMLPVMACLPLNLAWCFFAGDSANAVSTVSAGED